LKSPLRLAFIQVVIPVQSAGIVPAGDTVSNTEIAMEHPFQPAGRAMEPRRVLAIARVVAHA
jgi:hypothetical protein